MIALVIQLSGAVLLLTPDLLLKPSRAYNRVRLIAPVQGKVHPDLASVFQAIRIIWVAVMLIATGYLLAILGIEWTWLENQPAVLRLLMAMVMTSGIVWIGRMISRSWAARDFRNAKPFDARTDLAHE